MESKITIDVPEGYEAKEEKTENGINIVFVKKQDDDKELWFKSILDGLTVYLNDRYPDSVFYKKENEILFELCKSKNDDKIYFFVNYEKVWSVFYAKYKMKYDDIQLFIKEQVEKHLKLEGVTPLVFHYPTPLWWRNI